MSAVENKIRKEPAELRALARSERFVEILARLQGNDVAYTSSATLPSAAAEQLIRGRQYDAALAGIETALARFPSSLRLRQLQGLALRRSKRIEDAAYHLNLLLEEGHEDPETSGMLAAVYADVWAKKAAAGDARGARDALERSRSLYRQTFEKVPTDTYVGINAAAKSALLGELGLAKKLATDVLERLAEARVQRGGTPAADYWDRVTEPEALLITGDAEAALRLYHDARIAFQHETGSIESTALQVARLLAVLPVAEPTRQTLLDEFGLAS
jgi:tetratricopeptide (TPR) repeat protein